MSNEKLCADGHVIGENEEVCPRCGGLPVNTEAPAEEPQEEAEPVNKEEAESESEPEAPVEVESEPEKEEAEKPAEGAEAESNQEVAAEEPTV